MGRSWHRPYLLSGLILCGRCGKRFQAHKQSRGLIPAYYVCGSYLASGSSVCDGFRMSMPYIDDAVVDWIQKRIERVLDRETLTMRLREQLRPEASAGDAIEALEARLTETKRKIGRLVDALADGAENLSSITTRLTELEGDRASLELELARFRVEASAEPTDLTATVDRLLDALSQLTVVLATGEPEERKALVRVFLQEVRVEKTTRQATLKWYRLPRVTVKLVELRGLEPLTPRLPALCSPN